MNFSHITATIARSPTARTYLDALTGDDSVCIPDLMSAVRPAVIAMTASATRRPILVVTPNEDRALELASATFEYLDPEILAIHWPAAEAVPYDRLPNDPGAGSRRVSILRRLADEQSPAPVVFSSVAGLTHLVLSAKDLCDHSFAISISQTLSVEDLLERAVDMAYSVVPLVTQTGEIARRGGIVDIFPPGSRSPFRLEFFGDEVDTIRTFDPGSQRSHDKRDSLQILPIYELPTWDLPRMANAFDRSALDELRPEVAEEFARTLDRALEGDLPSSLDLFAPYLLKNRSTLIDHLPSSTLALLDEPESIERASNQYAAHAREVFVAGVKSGELPENWKRPIESKGTVRRNLGRLQSVALGSDTPDTSRTMITIGDFVSPPHFAGRLDGFVEEIGNRSSAGWRIAIATDQTERLTELLEDQDIFPRRRTRGSDSTLTFEEGVMDVIHSDLDGGWIEESTRSLMLSDLEIFGLHKRVRRGTASAFEQSAIDVASLTPGEHVVHIDYGVAKFEGLVRMTIGGVEREYLHLVYSKGEKLYVPVDQSHRVTRYSSGGLEPHLSRLGTGEWTRAKRRVRKAVREVAFELLNLYATREAADGFAFPVDTQWDLELADSFTYQETDDQHSAIIDVRRDMESHQPMDRLVCGDVGFGKTEVAIRAAFKAVNSGKQVAVLVPTTVLALQHFTTFTNRLNAFPVKVDMMSRLRSPAQQRATLKGLADGSVDIVIGTHRIVQPDIAFCDLGLAIIDEEQRFGVRQKEFFKQLRHEVDVITMSATPIPRTLHASLSGIRDISIISTPPQARLPIRTFVTGTDDDLIREVVLREIDRGGQVFVVHNRVNTIGRLAERIHKLVPEATVGIGHGQMEEDVLERIMIDFVDRKFDILVCTTIIESGVDIPNANTIVIDQADMLGLTQLYQLRGRVGRGPNRAYAYLLHNKRKHLTQEAEARLSAIQEATELGAGLKLAMRDMEIRGAGNILGAEQSGHIADVGYELYLRLLSQAVEEIRSGRPASEPGALTLDLPVTALIPADYVADVELRLALYREIAAIDDERGIGVVKEELVDRFGPIPLEVDRLLSLIALRIRCQSLGIESVVEREREMVVRPIHTSRIDTRKLQSRIGPAIRFTPRTVRLRLPDLEIAWSEALDALLEELERAFTSTTVTGSGREQQSYRMVRHPEQVPATG